MTVTESPYLVGNFGPVSSERTIPGADLHVEGAIPAELRGRYLRIGPNPHTLPTGPYHWFMGDGMVHGVELRDGNAQWYRNRWVRTDEVARALGETPVDGPQPPIYDSSNTNVLRHGGRILTLTEGSIPYEIDRELQTIGRYDFGGPLISGCTAHPKIDPVTGELHAISYWPVEPFVVYHQIDRDGRLVRTETINVPNPVMMHDFAITETSILFFDLPVLFDLTVQPFPFRWDPDNGARVGVMPRAGTGADTKWFDVETCYVFHPMNAYDDGDSVVVDVPRHPRMLIGGTGEAIIEDSPPTLDRWTIDMTGGKVREERVDDRGQEFPRVNESLLGSRHRYGYAVAAARGDLVGSEYYKHDFDHGTAEVHDFGAGRRPGEFVFVAREGAQSEDDGYLMGFVYDEAGDTSALEVLDAADLTRSALAKVQLPVRVPFGFHGNWIPDSGS